MQWLFVCPPSRTINIIITIIIIIIILSSPSPLPPPPPPPLGAYPIPPHHTALLRVGLSPLAVDWCQVR